MAAVVSQFIDYYTMSQSQSDDRPRSCELMNLAEDHLCPHTM